MTKANGGFQRSLASFFHPAALTRSTLPWTLSFGLGSR